MMVFPFLQPFWLIGGGRGPVVWGPRIGIALDSFSGILGIQTTGPQTTN